MEDSPYLSTTGAARYLGVDENGAPLVSPKTLEAWRVKGTGPEFCKIGRRVVYRREALDAWATATARRSTSQVVAA